MPEGNDGYRIRSVAPVPQGHPPPTLTCPDVHSTAKACPKLDEVRLGIEAEAGVSAAAAHMESRRLAINILAGGGANIVKIVLQLVMLPLMAHLLGPAEFGVYALALPTVAFFMTLADGGLGTSLAREPLEAREVWSTAFWLMLLVGLALTLIMAGWGFVLARLSQEPRVASVMALLSVSFALVASSVLPSARLTRERRLAAISGADLTGTMIGAALAVALARAGAGAMSLAAQYVATYLVRSVALNLIAFVRPSPVFRPAVLGSHLSTGSSLVASRLAESAGRLTENLMFGRLFGPAALGTFTFANQVPRFVCEAASGPLWGALYAHALKGDDEEVRQMHAKLMHLLALVLAPIAFLTATTVPCLVHLILGPAWQEAALILSVLIPFYGLNVVTTLSGAVLLARGAGWAIFWLLLALVLARITAVLPGPWIGPIGVAWGIGFAQILYTGLSLLALRQIGMPAGESLLRGVLPPTLAGILAGGACHLVLQGAPTDPLRLAFALLTGALAYIALIALMEGRRLREDVGGMIRLIRS